MKRRKRMKNKRAANRDHVEYKLVKILKVQHANYRPREENRRRDEAAVEALCVAWRRRPGAVSEEPI